MERLAAAAPQSAITLPVAERQQAEHAQWTAIADGAHSQLVGIAAGRRPGHTVPGGIASLRQDIPALLDAALQDSSRVTYMKILRSLAKQGWLPPFSVDMCLEIVSYAKHKGVTPATLQSWLSAISATCAGRPEDKPTHHFLVQRAKLGYRKIFNARRADGTQKPSNARAAPLLPGVMSRLLQQAEAWAVPRSDREAVAVLFLAYFLLLRGDSALRLTPSCIRVHEGQSLSLFTVPREKTGARYTDPRLVRVNGDSSSSRAIAFIVRVCKRQRNPEAVFFHPELALEQRKKLFNNTVARIVATVNAELSPSEAYLSDTVGFRGRATEASARPSAASAARVLGFADTDINLAANWVSRDMLGQYMRAGMPKPDVVVAHELGVFFGYSPPALVAAFGNNVGALRSPPAVAPQSSGPRSRVVSRNSPV